MPGKRKDEDDPRGGKDQKVIEEENMGTLGALAKEKDAIQKLGATYHRGDQNPWHVPRRVL